MIRRILTPLIIGILVLSAVVAVAKGQGGQRTLTADFPSTTSLYAGAKVKVLGVQVGSVKSIEVKGTKVQVTIGYDKSVQLPADVHAMIVPPSIVGDRFIQLAPAYDSGPVLPDRASLALDHTGVPLELDETYAALDKVATGLGPKGANKDGALSKLIEAAANNLDGRGKQFNATVRNLSGAVSTLAGSSDDITGTIRNSGKLADTLAQNDPELRDLVTSLARVSTQLNGQRDDIASAVKNLQEALSMVADFTKQNRSAIRSTVGGLTDVSNTLSARSKDLGKLLDIAPVGFTDLTNIYIPTNWNPAQPWKTPVGARTGVGNLRPALLDDLDVQLGTTLTALCAQLPAAQQQQLANFCSALQSVGGNLGAVLSKVLTNTGALNPSGGATSLDALLGGVG